MENGLENKLLKTYINSSPTVLVYQLTTYIQQRTRNKCWKEGW